MRLSRDQKRLAFTAGAGFLSLVLIEILFGKKEKGSGPLISMTPGVKYRFTYLFETAPKGVPSDPTLAELVVTRPNEKTVVLTGRYMGDLIAVRQRIRATSPLGVYERFVRKV